MNLLIFFPVNFRAYILTQEAQIDRIHGSDFADVGKTATEKSRSQTFNWVVEFAYKAGFGIFV